MRILVLAALVSSSALGAPQLLDGQFELPRGFHIYKAAGPELTGGSYDITFDGEGRLLVGDGNAVRRLEEKTGDGVYDSFEVIATGLGPRGPQGLLVWGDKLFAVGGDGIQVFEGYHSGGALKHKGRIGNKFQTGGDHDAHTIFRGHDGYLYFMAGNGAGISKRTHITESSSPSLIEREASVFRISPDGAHWECFAAGGRNPPNLGMNYLGELFSFDSDMEWHVGLPWYRPVRLNHWVVGGDQGWQEVGAYPPYYIDCLPGILDIGRGSPTWGTFYEHIQFPVKFRNSFLVCDYRWKRESNDQYNTTGRLVAFFLKRKGASWGADMETLARPKPGARDANGKLINFALVDVDVAPDGSIMVSDHNQGIWRIFYGDKIPPINVPVTPASKKRRAPTPDAVTQLLSLPQPMAEWSRAREEVIRTMAGPDLIPQLRTFALNSHKTTELRLAAVRYLFPQFRELPDDFIYALAHDKSPEVRGQAAALLGLRQQEDWLPMLRILLVDNDPFVRRRAAEALMRYGASNCIDALTDRLADHSRTVRYAAMIALAHVPTQQFFNKAAERREPEVRVRALAAAYLREELPPVQQVNAAIKSLMNHALFPEERLDFLRLVALFQKQIETDSALHSSVLRHLEDDFPASNRNVRWEQIRLIGKYKATRAFPSLLHALESEKDEVTQFHLAQAISTLPSGWTGADEERLVNWFLGTQRGWFADFAGKGVEFPQFWLTTLTDFATQHRSILLRNIDKVELGSLLGTATLDLLAKEEDGAKRLMSLYKDPRSMSVRPKVVLALANVNDPQVTSFYRNELPGASSPELRGALLKGLARAAERDDSALLFGGISHADPQVVRACATSLIRLQPVATEEHARLVFSRMAENNSLCKILDPLARTLAQTNVPPLDRITDSIRLERLKFWQAWYQNRFGKSLQLAGQSAEKSDEQLLEFLLSDKAKGGNRLRGGEVYEKLQCNSCHGGGVNPGREGKIFGPDLSGVTRRLSPREFAESLVYPSKQVAERYKAYEVTLNDGPSLSGFITEQNDTTVTLADREQVHRIARSQIRSLAPQSTSLMPEHLLNVLSWEEVRDLIAFLDEKPMQGGAAR